MSESETTGNGGTTVCAFASKKGEVIETGEGNRKGGGKGG